MGKKDIGLKVYLSDARRYADLWNGSVFQGKQVVIAEELQQVSPVLSATNSVGMWEKIQDLVMKQNRLGQRFVLWTVENQENIDYRMPIRVMLQEALAYENQIREKQKQHKSRTLNSSSEFLCRFRKNDKIFPIATLVVYWGEKEWDGPKSLHDMIDWGLDCENTDAIKMLVPEYPLHFLNVAKFEHPEYFKTELRPFLELYRCRNDKDNFINYIRSNAACEKMDNESWEILGNITHAGRMICQLTTKFEKKSGEDKVMCKALEEFYNDGIAEGKASAIVELLGDLGEVSKETREKIYHQKNPEILKAWLKKVVQMKSIAEFENYISQDM